MDRYQGIPEYEDNTGGGMADADGVPDDDDDDDCIIEVLSLSLSTPSPIPSHIFEFGSHYFFVYVGLYISCTPFLPHSFCVSQILLSSEKSQKICEFPFSQGFVNFYYFFQNLPAGHWAFIRSQLLI